MEKVGAVFMYGTIGHAAFMRPDGVVLIQDADDQWSEATGKERWGSIVLGAKHLPELRRLLLSDRSGRALVHGAADLDSFRGSYVLIAAVSVGRTSREPPNKRLKLTAPVVYGRIPFVIIPAWRRSLGAPR